MGMGLSWVHAEAWAWVQEPHIQDYADYLFPLERAFILVSFKAVFHLWAELEFMGIESFLVCNPF